MRRASPIRPCTRRVAVSTVPCANIWEGPIAQKLLDDAGQWVLDGDCVRADEAGASAVPLLHGREACRAACRVSARVTPQSSEIREGTARTVCMCLST
eukprot:11002-Eustigmatos_ZCMA.PRE.1